MAVGVALTTAHKRAAGKDRTSRATVALDRGEIDAGERTHRHRGG